MKTFISKRLENQIPYSLIAFVVSAFIGLNVFAIILNNKYLILLSFLLPIGIIIWTGDQIVLIVLVLLFFSSLHIPNFPANFNIFYALALIGVPFVILKKYSHTSQHSKKNVHKWLYPFLLVILITIIFRGVGIGEFGGKQIGGFAYFQIFIIIGLIFIFENVSMKAKHWKKALIGMCLLSFLPVAAELMVYSGVMSSSSFVLQFFNLRPEIEEMAYQTYVDPQYRLFSAGIFGPLLFLAVLLFRPIKKNDVVRNTILVLAFFVSIGIAGISGHRYSTITLALLIIYFILLERRIKIRKIAVALISCGIVLILLLSYAYYFPFAIQRSFAGIPFANISQEAEQDASGTSIWRVKVWELAILHLLPKYWLLGKGLSFSEWESLNIYIPKKYAWALETRNYHNGPLSVIITFGIPGLVCFTFFLFFMIKRHYRLSRFYWKSDLLRHFHIVMLSYLITQVSIFLFIFGEIDKSLLMVFFLSAILEGLVSSDSYVLNELRKFRYNKRKND